MNERIRELAKQAGDYVNETYTGPVRSKTPGKIWEDGHVGWHTQFNEKFAELIVLECISITDELVVNSTRTSNELYADHNGALFEVKRRIESHFGVEE